MKNVPASGHAAFAYFSLSPSADVSFAHFPKVTLSLPSAPASHGGFYAWLYNVNAKTWSDLGGVMVSGSTMSFGGSDSPVTMSGRATYVAVIFTANTGATCPLPVRIYVSGGSGSFVGAYDENGTPVKTPGGFPGIFIPRGIAFDSANRNLYIINTHQTGVQVFQVVDVYTEDGTHIPTSSGAFAGLLGPTNIAFDPANRQLYVLDGNTLRVYDDNGDTVNTSGTFPNLFNATGITFDSANRHLYVTNGIVCSTTGCKESVNAYDEQGNPITTSGGFPNLTNPTGIAFDSSNHDLYVADNENTAPGHPPGGGRVFDQDGNPLTAGAAFANLGNPFAIAFDPANLRLDVVYPLSGNVVSFDEQGDEITSFPVVAPTDVDTWLTVAPQ